MAAAPRFPHLKAGASTGLPAMKEAQYQFLTLERLPARLTAEQVAWPLNCQIHDVPILIASRLLKPLGNPAPNGIKFFDAGELQEQIKDRGWLIKMTNAINLHWRKNNDRKTAETNADLIYGIK